MAHIGIIGGSGLYALEGLKGLKEIHVDTPYGRPRTQSFAGNWVRVHCFSAAAWEKPSPYTIRSSVPGQHLGA